MTPPVRPAEPPAIAIRIVNPVLKRVLASPLGRYTGRTGLMLLRVTGRRSGRRIEVPVGRHEVGGRLLAVTGGGRWSRNFVGGADCELVFAGTTRRAHGVLDEDPDAVATTYAALIEQAGLENAQRLGLRVVEQRMPTHAELVEALGGQKAIVRLHLTA